MKYIIIIWTSLFFPSDNFSKMFLNNGAYTRWYSKYLMSFLASIFCHFFVRKMLSISFIHYDLFAQCRTERSSVITGDLKRTGIFLYLVKFHLGLLWWLSLGWQLTYSLNFSFKNVIAKIIQTCRWIKAHSCNVQELSQLPLKWPLFDPMCQEGQEANWKKHSAQNSLIFHALGCFLGKFLFYMIHTTYTSTYVNMKLIHISWPRLLDTYIC